MRNIDFYKQPAAFLEKLNFIDKKLLSKIVEIIENLRIEALPKDCKKLVGKWYYIVFASVNIVLFIVLMRSYLTITTIAKREDVYDFFKN